MLGLGRALGETMAVTIILSVSGVVTFNLISQANPSTIAANIALDFPESSGLAINALIATGLVLFAITLVTNMARAPSSPASTASRWRLSQPTTASATPGAGSSGSAAASCRAGRPTASPAPPPSPPRPAGDRRVRHRADPVIAVPLAGIAIYAWSRAVEGPRRAKDRVVTLAIAAAFALAMLPLISLLYEVAKRGIPGFSVEFFTESARGVINGGGAAHAIVGTLVITGVAAADLGPDRDHGRDLPDRVRRPASCAGR